MQDRGHTRSKLVSSRPSPALVVATIALFVSMGGVSYGLATGSIGSREIKNRSIQGKDVGKNEITAREIARRSIDGTDVKVNRVGGNAVKEEVLEAGKIGKVAAAIGADTLGGLTAQQIIAQARQGATGPQGPAGPRGAAGADGADGATDVVVRYGNNTIALGDERTLARADCDAGEVAIAGGGAVTNGAEDVDLQTSRPVGSNGGAPGGWLVIYDNDNGETTHAFVQAYVVCASP